MPGFFGVISKKDMDFSKIKIRKSKVAKVMTQRFVLSNNVMFERFPIRKFLKDKIIIDDSNTFAMIDGVVFNFKELRNKFSVSSNEEVFKKGLKEYGINFIKDLRGNFSGFVYDKKRGVIHIFTDHLSSKPIYYYHNPERGLFVFATELKSITHFLNDIGMKIKLNEMGAYCLLTFGYMLEDLTIAEDVRKLRPGHVLKYDGNVIENREYYRLDNTPKIFDKEEAIKGLHERFEYAVKLEYEKDEEYGYESIATLSGGLDSKMNVYYAVRTGYRPLCITFSESDYWDEKIAKSFARDLKLEFLFYALDNGTYIAKILHEILETNDALAFYIGSAHAFSMLKKINFKNYGLLHTGQLGDAVLGTYLKASYHLHISAEIVKKYAYSKKLMPRLQETLESIIKGYDNYEIFAFYNRGFNGIFNGYRTTEQFTEFSSPFLFVDFLEYALKIDPKLRIKEKVYLEWLKNYASMVYKYPWENYKGLKASTPYWIAFIKKAYKHVRKRILGQSRKDSMNPLEYWWKTNEDIRNFYSKFFDENISLLEKYPQLMKDAEYLFSKGNMIEKSQVLTLLGSFKLLEIL